MPDPVRRAGAWWLAAALAGCSTAPVVVPADAVDDVALPAGGGHASAWICGPVKLAFLDARSTPEMGHLGGRSYTLEELPQWLEGQLRRHVPHDEASAAELDVKLERAYLETNRSTLSFTVILSARRVDLGDAQSRYYRGMDTKINWLGSDSELANYVERAAANALQNLIDLEGKRCADRMSAAG